MKLNRLVFVALLGGSLVCGALGTARPALALSEELEVYLGDDPTLFDTPEAGVEAFKTIIATGDIQQISKLLGLDAAKLASAEGIADRIGEIKAAAAQLLNVEEDEDQLLLNLGDDVWTFPFPLVKGDDGKWAFDTVAGIEEIINRRIGENELQAIATARTYVDAQRDYASEDRDEDGVLEYAQKLISTEGQTDGLYWPLEQGDGESPAGPSIDQGALEKAAAGEGYFGYKFRILTGQGANVAGGSYDYVVNGNMISGFALVAWPAKYEQTGVTTFVVNHAGIVYEKDLGPDTEKTAVDMKAFDPDETWELVDD